MLPLSLSEPKHRNRTKHVLKRIKLIDDAEITEKSVVLATKYSVGFLVKFYLTHFACDSCNEKSTVTHPR